MRLFTWEARDIKFPHERKLYISMMKGLSLEWGEDGEFDMTPLLFACANKKTEMVD